MVYDEKHKKLLSGQPHIFQMLCSSAKVKFIHNGIQMVNLLLTLQLQQQNSHFTMFTVNEILSNTQLPGVKSYIKLEHQLS